MTISRRVMSLVFVVAVLVGVLSIAPFPQLACAGDGSAAIAGGCERPEGEREHAPPRIVRFRSAANPCPGGPCFGLVLDSERGVPRKVFNLSAFEPGLGSALAEFTSWTDGATAGGFELAKQMWGRHGEAAFRGGLGGGSATGKSIAAGGDGYSVKPEIRRLIEELPDAVRSGAIAPVVDLDLDSILKGERISIGVGLNYDAHAAEAGGGEIFLFPKVVATTGPYDTVARPADVQLLDYEVELGFVTLEDIDLGALPTAEELESRLAYFTTNDVTDRAPIIRDRVHGFAQAKSRPGFLPSGPWMIRGSDLRAFSSTPGARPLSLYLEVDAGDGPDCRQSATTALMRAEPHAILSYLAEHTKADVVSPMPFNLEGRTHRLPLARAEGSRRVLPAFSVIGTGTPAGVALHAPGLADKARLAAWSLLTLTAPTEVFLNEQLESVPESRYLRDGHRVTAGVEMLGVQTWGVTASVGD